MSRQQPLDSQTMMLPDGRTLGYAEYGAADGRPVVLFHGFPSSRLEAMGADAIARRCRLRLLALDRPGFGLSSPSPGRNIGDWPADVRAFAGHVKLERFAVFGGSGGGPYALACAAVLPANMMTSVGVLAGAGPWRAGIRDVLWSAWLTHLAAVYCPAALRIVSNGLVGTARWLVSTGPVSRWIDRFLAALSAKRKKEGWPRELTEPAEAVTDGKKRLEGGEEEQLPLLTADKTADKQAEEASPSAATANKNLSSPASERRERMIRILFEPFAQGAGAFVQEARLLTSLDWGFRVEDIKYNGVKIWHGTKDRNAPIRMARYMAERLPGCVMHEYEGEDHFSTLKHLDEILGELVADEEGEGEASGGNAGKPQT